MVDESSFRSIKRHNVVDDIIEQFKQALIKGDFQPGQKLPSEPELSEQLGVGRSTVREAIKILGAMGAVEVRRGDGTYVSEGVSPAVIQPLLFAILVEPKDAEDLYEFRRIIEVGYCKLAAEKADMADFERMESVINEMEQYFTGGGRDTVVLAELDLKFHTAILEATKNPYILQVGGLLNTLFAESLKQANATTDGVAWTLQRHRRLVDLLRERDTSVLDEEIAFSLQGWKRRMENADS